MLNALRRLVGKTPHIPAHRAGQPRPHPYSAQILVKPGPRADWPSGKPSRHALADRVGVWPYYDGATF